jgi:hypothetical protein
MKCVTAKELVIYVQVIGRVVKPCCLAVHRRIRGGAMTIASSTSHVSPVCGERIHRR